MKIAMFVASVVLAAGQALPATAHISYTQFLQHVRAGEVASAVITSGRAAAPVTARLRDGRAIDTVLPGDYDHALTLMQERNVDVEIVAAPLSLWNAVPFGLLLAVWLILLWRVRRGKTPWLPA